MLAALMMDVEDLITEESDESALWVAEMFREEGLTASFYVVGEKARLWERRGRQDVIEAFKRHDIGFHATWHSIHPTMAEVCQDLDFLSGMEALWRKEKQGWRDAERIFGRPLSSWATTGSSWCPSLSGLMGKLGRAYVYSPIHLPGHNVCWFANAVHFCQTLGGFDDTFADDHAFQAKLAETQAALARPEALAFPFMGIFLGHPTKLISVDFWDAVNFAKGANPERSQWIRQEFKSREQWPIIQRNFRKLLQTIRSCPSVKVLGTAELARSFDAQKPFMAHEDLLAICRQVAREERILFTPDFTAGEILCAMCLAAQKEAPRYPRQRTLGPNALPPVSSITTLDATSTRATAPGVLTHVLETGLLPSVVGVGKEQIGVGTYFVALGKALAGEDPVTAPGDAFYPDEAKEVARAVESSVPGWVIHPPDLRMDQILLHTKLQCWTLKPAWEK